LASQDFTIEFFMQVLPLGIYSGFPVGVLFQYGTTQERPDGSLFRTGLSVQIGPSGEIGVLWDGLGWLSNSYGLVRGSGTTLVPSMWEHVAIHKVGSSIQLFVNGGYGSNPGSCGDNSTANRVANVGRDSFLCFGGEAVITRDGSINYNYPSMAPAYLSNLRITVGAARVTPFVTGPHGRPLLPYPTY
jgi:hypothetical protein